MSSRYTMRFQTGQEGRSRREGYTRPKRVDRRCAAPECPPRPVRRPWTAGLLSANASHRQNVRFLLAEGKLTGSSPPEADQSQG